MSARTVYAVAVETESSGAVDWYAERAAAETAFNEAVCDFGNEEVNLFSFEVEPDASADEVTDEADALMWDREYQPIRSHNRGASLVGGAL